MSRQVEILSPAGSYESLVAAIHAGADAVYIGGTRFGARAYADNLTEEQLLDAIDFVHLHGKRIYLTINTLLKEHELNEELYNYLLPYYKHGIDAVIVQDVGVIQFVKNKFPDLPIHASTQMTVTNVLGAKFVEQLGVERVVTAREMQLSEIKEIAEHTNLEIESFVHGALCYCYSGQCLYSSLIGGRSGNRGQCAQPCRLPYKVQGEREAKYILSLKDMCTLEYIPELIEAGIYSFKIEGRMKKPEYVALVTAMYRKYVDMYLEKGKSKYRVEPKDREMLMDLYNRGGSHGGYYFMRNGREMLSISRPNHAGVPALKVEKVSGKNVSAKALVDIHKGDVFELPEGKENYTISVSALKGELVTFYTHQKQNLVNGAVINRIRNEQLISEIRTQIIERKVQEKITGVLTLRVGEVAKLNLKYSEYEVEVTGDVVEKALNQPMSEERIEKQLKKTGNTPFVFDKLNLVTSGNLFIPLQSLNELRRRGLEILQEKIVSSYRRAIPNAIHCVKEAKVTEFKPQMYVYVETLEQWKTVLKCNIITRIYLDCNAIDKIWENTITEEVIEQSHVAGKQIYFAMPHVFRSKTNKIYEQKMPNIFGLAWDGILVRNLESYMFLQEHKIDKCIVTDYNLYQFNRCAKEFWLGQNVEATTAPLELNYHELKSVGLEESDMVVYGYLPMMISAQCIKNTVEGCKKEKDEIEFRDRYQKDFTVKNHCDYCYNVIYNTTPMALTDQKYEIMKLCPKALRLHFTLEDSQQTSQVIELYENVFFKDYEMEPNFEFTRGHFKRGIK